MNRFDLQGLPAKLGTACGAAAVSLAACYSLLGWAVQRIGPDTNAVAAGGTVGALLSAAIVAVMSGYVAGPLRRNLEDLEAANEELRQVNARLEAEVADRTARLAAANEEFRCALEHRRQAETALTQAKEAAESANRTKTLFLANMSHELRTPLHAIMGFAEILESQLFGPIGNARYREYATDIRRSGEHLLKLINELLDVSRIEAGAFTLEEEVLSLPVIVESCFQLVGQRARDQGVRLRQRMRPGLPQLRGDAVRMKQILLNLLDNGIKFTPEGGLVSLEAVRLAGGAVEIRIDDTGIGIAAEDLATALSTFGQADGSYTRKQDGAGLGLPLAKALTEKHGGSLRIESEPGVGTRITLLFPAERTVPAAPAAASATGAEERRARREEDRSGNAAGNAAPWPSRPDQIRARQSTMIGIYT